MKKLYRKGTVHPSPSPSPSPSSSSSTISDEFSLSYLPAAILTLAAALSAADKEVLSYLLAADKEQPHHHHHRNKKHHHSLSPCFTCYCFNCYTSYWARWDSSPNRQLIHEIIDAFEDDLLSKTKTNNNKNNKKQGLTRREKRKNNTNHNTKNPNLDSNLNMIDDGNDYIGSGRVNLELGQPESEREAGGQHGNGGGDDETGEKQGSVRKLVGFIGERIWGTVWG